jgi:hypothetical protein
MTLVEGRGKGERLKTNQAKPIFMGSSRAKNPFTFSFHVVHLLSPLPLKIFPSVCATNVQEVLITFLNSRRVPPPIWKRYSLTISEAE